MVENVELKLVEKKILSALDANARIPISTLARRLKKSKQLVSYHLKRLESAGIIKGYNAVIDFSKLGYMSFRVYIVLKPVSPSQQKELVNFLKDQKEVWWLVDVENVCDIAYATLVKNIGEFYAHLERVSKFNTIIQSKNIVVYSHIMQFQKAYLLGKETNSGILIGANSSIDVDEVDWKLLDLLSQGARKSLVDLGLTMHMKPQSIKYRLRNLEKKGIIRGYRANINIEKLGLKNYKIYLTLLNNSRIKELETFCAVNKWIVTTNKTIGGADFEIELQLLDIDALHKILDEIRERFHDVLANYQYGVAREEIKMTYLPYVSKR